MGTSQSSKGAPSGSSLIPSWIKDSTLEVPSPAQQLESTPEESNQSSTPNLERNASLPEPISPIAPPGRFRGARRNISDYAQTASAYSLSKGLGHYVKKGMGGSKNAAKRLKGTTVAAASLYNSLTNLANQTTSNRLDRNVILNKPKKEIIDYIVNTLVPTNGTLDSEARQRSMNNAIANLYEKDDDVDICNLSDEQVIFCVEAFVIEEIIRRFELDLGQSIIENALNASDGTKKIKDARDYISETAKASFRKLKNTGNNMNASNVKSIVDRAIQNTFDVFCTEGE